MRRFLANTTSLDFPLALFLLSAVLGVLPAYDRASAWLPLAVLLGCGVLYLLVSRFASREKSWLRMAQVISVLGGLVAVYFITQVGHYPSPDKVEAISRLGDWLGKIFPSFVIWAPYGNSVATLLEGLLFLAVGAGLAVRNERSAWKWLMWIFAALMALALLISESRGAWVAVAAAALLWLALYFRPLRWLAYASALLMLIMVVLVVVRRDIAVLGQIPVIDRTLAPLFFRPDRLAVYRGSIALLQDVPITGIGLGGQFAMNYSSYVLLIQVPYLYYSHNLYLEIWLQQGLLGLVAWVWIIATLAYNAFRVWRHGHDWLYESTWVGVVAILLHGVTDARQYADLWTWLPFFILLGLNSAYLLQHRQELPGKNLWIPAAAAGVVLISVTVMLPSLPAAWHANMGSLQQARADLSSAPDIVRQAERELAVQEFQQAAAVAPSERTAHYRLGLIYTIQNQFSQAVEQLERAYAVGSGSPGVKKALGLAYVWTGQVDRAANMLREVPGIVTELNTWGWWRSSHGQTDLSRYAYQCSLLLNPDQPEIKQALDGLAN